MGRIPRRRLGGGVFHVVNRGINKTWIINDPEDKKVFIELLARERKKYSMDIYHWCVMSNHFHLAVEALKVSELSAYVGKVCELYSRYFHRRHGGCGTVWQGRYKSCVVQKEGYLLRLGRYIERNPVRAELEQAPWDYEWSSSRAYAKGGRDILVSPERHPAWNQFGGNDGDRRLKYRQILNNGKEAASEESMFVNLSSRVVGDEDFSRSLRNSLGRLISRKPGRRK